MCNICNFIADFIGRSIHQRCDAASGDACLAPYVIGSPPSFKIAMYSA